MNTLYFAFALIGFSSMIVQVVLLREMINLFSGNELVYGLTFAVWLVMTAAGSLIGAVFTDRIRNRTRAFISSQLMLALTIPAAIFLSMSIKYFLRIPFETMTDLTTTLFLTFMILSVPCLIIGLQFTLGSKVLREHSEDRPDRIGNMYTLESIGSLIGGAVFSFIFVLFLNAFQIAGILTVLLTLSALTLYKNHVRKFAKSLLKAGPILVFALMLALGIVLIYPSGIKIGKEGSGLFWHGRGLLESVDSVYGRSSVTEDRNGRSFYRNSNFIFSTSENALNEELVHLSFLEANAPKRALLIGGGLGGALREAAKYGIPIDYLEYDPAAIELSRRYFGLDRLLKNRNITIHSIDGRSFVNRTHKVYDLIIVNAGDPEDALTNRFYTIEFFRKCARIMGPRGVISVNLPYSEGYMNRPLKQLNSSIYRTISDVFRKVAVIPSIRNYMFASNSDEPTDKANTLIARWYRNNISTGQLNANSLPYIAYPLRIISVKDSIAYNTYTRVNSDISPVSYLYGLDLWLSHFPRPAGTFLSDISSAQVYMIIIILYIIVIALEFLSGRIKAFDQMMVPSAVFLIGFVGMSGELLLIYMFQSFYGNLYSIIGFLLALFMAGLAAGSYLMNKGLGRSDKNTLGKISASLAIFLIIVYAYMALIPGSSMPFAYETSRYVLPLFIFLLSIHVGAYFPAAARLYSERSKGLTAAGGILYGVDLAGGALASIMAGVLLLPLLGLSETLLLLVAISAGCFILTLKG